MDISSIINSEESVFKNLNGEILRKPVFKSTERERASKISEHLRGLTVFEARDLLDKLLSAVAIAANFEKIE